MLRTTTLIWLACGGWLLAAGARAESFAIDLEVRADKLSQTAHAETAGLVARPQPRPVLETQAGRPVTVKWTLRSTDQTTTVKDVLVHFFAVAEEKAGQAAVPKLDKDVAAEAALTMDFKPKDATEGELHFTIDKPGCYLLRLETVGAAVGVQGHEYFAALDLVVH